MWLWHLCFHCYLAFACNFPYSFCFNPPNYFNQLSHIENFESHLFIIDYFLIANFTFCYLLLKIFCSCCSIYFLNFLLHFSHYHLVPLYLPPLQSPHYCPCPRVLFPSSWSLHPLTSPQELPACSLSMSLSLFCLLVHFVH